MNLRNEWSREVLEHVALYGLTTRRVLKRAVFSGDGAAANDVVRALLDEARLFRHGGVLTASKHSPTAQEIHRNRVVLHFCCLGTRLRPLVPRADLERILAPISEQSGIAPPKNARCIIDRERRLSLVRVQSLVASGSELDLGRELGKLQSLVEDKSFRPWVMLATRGGFSLTYLVTDCAKAEEISRWIPRRPLYATLRPAPVMIPVEVHHTRLGDQA